MMLYDHYGRYLWLLSDHTSCQLNVLLGKHTDEQRELIDLIVERVRELGAATTVPLQVAELTVVSRPLKGVGDVPAMLAGLLEAHELIIGRIREAITMTATSRDRETNDLLRDALRRHESQAWSIADHIAESDAKRA
jgi:starvation-inducible DNA-binding protein